MFSGLTASQYAIKNAGLADEDEPVLTPDAECDHWQCQDDAVHHMATHAIPIHGVGCRVEQWEKLCEDHWDSGDLGDDTFYCEDCDHTHLTNSSWEMHYAQTDEGPLCLKCYAEQAVEADRFWIRSPRSVNAEWVHSRPHVIPELVPSKCEDTGFGISLDSMSGGGLYDEGAGAQARGVELVREEVRKALASVPPSGPEHKVGVVISRAYQFAVYLEVVREPQPTS